MRFIVGKFAQGKLNYTLKKYGFKIDDVCNLENEKTNFSKPILYNFHVLAKDLMKSGKKPSEYVRENIDLLRNKIIISDDIGGGVVPIDKTDREYREVAGRLNCAVAEYADSVERIFCGISQQIK